MHTYLRTPRCEGSQRLHISRSAEREGGRKREVNRPSGGHLTRHVPLSPSFARCECPQMQAMLQTTKEEASKAGGEKERLLEELECMKAEVASKQLESESLLKSLRGKERELSEKDKAVSATKAQLAAKDKETQKLYATIALLNQQNQPSTQLQPPSPHAAAACGDSSSEVAEVEKPTSLGAFKRTSLGACPSRKSLPPPVLGGCQQDVHGATMLTRRASSSSFAPSADASCAVDKLDAEDDMSASVSNNIAAEAAAVAASVAQEGEEDLLSYLQPGASNGNEISFSEVDDKENADCNAEWLHESQKEAQPAADVAKESEGKDQSATRTETLEERLERFRKKKEESKKQLAAGTQSTPTTPTKIKGIGKRDLKLDVLNAPASAATSRLSLRPQSALSRPATAIPKPPGALSGGAARPKTAAPKGPLDKLASRPRVVPNVDRSQRSTGWR